MDPRYGHASFLHPDLDVFIVSKKFFPRFFPPLKASTSTVDRPFCCCSRWPAAAAGSRTPRRLGFLNDENDVVDATTSHVTHEINRRLSPSSPRLACCWDASSILCLSLSQVFPRPPHYNRPSVNMKRKKTGGRLHNSEQDKKKRGGREKDPTATNRIKGALLLLKIKEAERSGFFTCNP